MPTPRLSLALLFTVLAAAACSSSTSDATPAPAPGENDGGAADGATANDAGPAQDGATPIDAAPPTSMSGCSYSVDGALTVPTTDAPYGCANGKVEQPNGSGDLTASFGGGFMAPSGEIVSLACTLSAPTAPGPGTVWTLTTSAQTTGNCMLNSIKGSAASSWVASTVGTATATFVSATLTHGTAHPSDVYYLFELNLTATLKAQGSSAADVTISGHFSNAKLPTGS
ncbi:MAG: hypothetical protein JWP97_4150 [Labilithrix sp.]|nr:hypothetical protein [Labilithrix sp.]